MDSIKPLEKSSANIAISIEALQNAIAEMPQWDAGDRTSHYFADQMYCRVLFRPKGTLIVGKMHKKSHFYIVARGRVSVTGGNSPATIYQAGDVIVSKPGTKRAVLALEDSICMTIHRTDKTDLDEIEKEIVEEDSTALFDARNKVRMLK